MNASIWVAVIGAAAGLLTAAFTYAITKRREREADWRKLKLEMYREFTTALAGMAEGDAKTADKVRFNVASNSLPGSLSSHEDPCGIQPLERWRFATEVQT